MSIGSFLAKLWETVKNLFAQLPQEYKIAVHIGVQVVENMKAFTDSPLADILTAIIPGDVDDLIKAKLRAALPVFLQELKLADATLSLNDPDAILKAGLQTLNQFDPIIKPGFLHQLSILIAQVAADGKLSWSDGVVVLEWYYKNKYQPATN